METVDDGCRSDICVATQAHLEVVSLLSIVLAMLVILALAVGIVVYVAFPHRGEPVPHAPWLGDGMDRIAKAVPALQGSPERSPERSPEHQRS